MVRFSAQYLGATSADNLLFDNLFVFPEPSVHVVRFSVLPISLACFGCGDNHRYKYDSVKNCEKDGYPGWMEHACQQHMSVRKQSVCFTKREAPLGKQRDNHDAIFQQTGC